MLGLRYLENRNQHLNQQGNCIRTNGCANSDVGQGTLGNDNSVTGFTDQSGTNATTPNAVTSEPAAAGPGAQGIPGAKGDKGDPEAKGDKGDPGAKGIKETQELKAIKETEGQLGQ
jgi:hypothetical protein